MGYAPGNCSCTSVCRQRVEFTEVDMQRAKGLSCLGSHGARRRTHAVRVCVLVRDGICIDEVGALACSFVVPIGHSQRQRTTREHSSRIVVGPSGVARDEMDIGRRDCSRSRLASGVAWRRELLRTFAASMTPGSPPVGLCLGRERWRRWAKGADGEPCSSLFSLGLSRVDGSRAKRNEGRLQGTELIF